MSDVLCGHGIHSRNDVGCEISSLCGDVGCWTCSLSDVWCETYFWKRFWCEIYSFLDGFRSEIFLSDAILGIYSWSRIVR